MNPHQSIGHYRIEAKLGSGGMGVVYRAFDTRLQRQVALKVLQDEGLADPESKQRLLREARAASALNHPNIVTVHEVGSEAGLDFIAMEFVDGKTLDAVIPPNGLPAATALEYATQITGGLAKAHAVGLVHRDLKPGNIMVTREGLVKLLDFGLARQVRPVSDQETTITVEGAIVGTPAYMSPEQAQGKAADARSDVFSFGVVLYEMLSGRRAFAGDSAALVLAAVLRDEAVPLGDDIPPELDKIVRRCLRKDPDRRFQSMADLRVALQDVAQESKSQPAVAAQPAVARSRRTLWVAAGALALSLAAGWWLRNSWQPELPEPRLVQLTSNPGGVCCPTFSPDGKQVAFMWGGEKGDHPDIYVKMVGEVNAVRLTNGQAAASFPVWSPDGKRIAFRRLGPGGGIWTMSPLGGAEQKLADLPHAGPMSWSPDGKWLAAARYSVLGNDDERGVFLVPSDGSVPRRITSPKQPANDFVPSFSPDGRFLAYASCATQWSCDVFVQKMDASYSPRGIARRITQQGFTITGLAWARDGESLVYGASASADYLYRMWRVDSSGKREPRRYDLAGFGVSQPAIAPAGNRLAFYRFVSDTHIWRYQAGEVPKPFMASSTVEANVEFSPDGSRVAFSSGRSGDRVQIWLANADGTRLVQLTSGLGYWQALPVWSPDGRRIAFQSHEEGGLSRIYVVDADGGRPKPVLAGAYVNAMATWSRDGKWIYFRSNRAGRAEIWRVASEGGEEQQVTHNGGLHAVESTDGKTLFYSNPGGLVARRLADGSEQPVLESVVGKLFAPVGDGIYYIGSRGPDARHRPLQFYDFATRTSRLVANLEGYFVQGGLSVSPDRKTILYTASVNPVSDLMMIENFR